MSKFLLAIDQGTTNTRAIIFDQKANVISSHQISLQQYYPESGWVEHDPEEIWQAVLRCIQLAFAKARLVSSDVIGIGITNQRETTVIWDKKNLKPIYKAIVWQDRRTAQYCKDIDTDDAQRLIQVKTGLCLDPYFSATKIKWILDHVVDAGIRAQAGELAFGTIDSFILARLTRGKSHFIDVTNAARTLLFNIKSLHWDEDLLSFFEIPAAILPVVKNTCDHFGVTDKTFFDFEIPIYAMAGDQQAAMIGQACIDKDMAKSTYGTGCFVLLNTNQNLIYSQNQLLSTIVYKINKKICYGMEGSVFNAGTVVQWMRDQLQLIEYPEETEALAKSLANNAGVYFVPAFTGLGAPYWRPLAKGGIWGLTRDSHIAHIVRAGLESVCYQTKDLIEAMLKDSGTPLTVLRVDGGMANNNWLMQFLADILNVNVERPKIIETTALGIALLAGLQAGVYTSLNDFKLLWQPDKLFEPQMSQTARECLYSGWQEAVRRVIL